MRRKVREIVGGTWGLKGFLLLLSALFIFVATPMPAHAQSNASPVFPTDIYTRSIAENSATFRSLGEPLQATDPDVGDTVTYSLLSGDMWLFNIQEATGQLEILEPLNYEMRSSYWVTVRATDSGGLYDTVYVNITVSNVDEAGQVIVSPTLKSTRAVLNAFLIDPDGRFSHVSWQWAASPDQVNWTDIPGARSAYYVPRLEDLPQFLKARATYSDGQGPGKVAESVFDTEMFSRRNNNPPEFPLFESGVRTLRGDAGSGEEVGLPLLAADLDRDLLTYVLSGEASLLFDIGLHSGQLKTRNSLYHQSDGRYFGVVHVVDGKGGSASKGVRIDVGNIFATVPLPAQATAPLEEEPALVTEPLTSEEKALNPDPTKTASVSFRSDWPQSSVTFPHQPSTVVSINESRNTSAQSLQEMLDSAPFSRSSETRVVTTLAPEASDEPVAWLAGFSPSPPLDPTGGAVTGIGSSSSGGVGPAGIDSSSGGVGPAGIGSSSDGVGPAGIGSSSSGGVGPAGIGSSSSGGVGSAGTDDSGWFGFGSLFFWAVLFFLSTLLASGVLAMWLRSRRVREREITLPPPTIGPYRRIAPLPIRYSQANDDTGPRVGTVRDGIPNE